MTLQSTHSPSIFIRVIEYSDNVVADVNLRDMIDQDSTMYAFVKKTKKILLIDHWIIGVTSAIKRSYFDDGLPSKAFLLINE